MAASEYLSTKSEGGGQDPLKASLYTGSVYVIAVLLLILPYLILGNYFSCLVLSVLNAILLILVFTFYVSVARDIPFRKRFFEMAGISLGIAAITFGIGVLVKAFLDLDV
jgi:VIT1/CCC1 family predicted Fe2+/Mn2+ transporter